MSDVGHIIESYQYNGMEEKPQNQKTRTYEQVFLGRNFNEIPRRNIKDKSINLFLNTYDVA